MERKAVGLSLLVVLWSVLCAVYAHDSSESGENDGHRDGHRKIKKIVILSLFAVFIVGVVIGVVVLCYCKKKKANKMKTSPSPDSVVSAGPLPQKDGLYPGYTGAMDGIYNGRPTYDGINTPPGQPERPVISPPPPYGYDQ